LARITSGRIYGVLDHPGAFLPDLDGNAAEAVCDNR